MKNIVKKFFAITILAILIFCLVGCSKGEETTLTDIPSKYLPIGSVVILQGGDQPLMIYGRAVAFDSGETRDYMAVLYPQGYIDTEHVYSFNHSDISQVLYLGYDSEDNEKINAYLLENIG